MEITFRKSQLEDINKALAKEWIESDGLGNYSSSTILGLNTRKKHGLFVLKHKETNDHFLILSHMQEEYHNGSVSFKLFNIEYKKKLVDEGLAHQTEFKLDPYPTFIFKCGNTQIEKSILLIYQRCLLICRYKFFGPLEKGHRFVIRPFFAFRSVNSKTDSSIFTNTEFFVDQNQLRFLPYPDIPEIYISQSHGNYINASMWYHEFQYRNEENNNKWTEDLLNPGFFELNINDGNQFYVSFGLEKINYRKIPDLFQQEVERRFIKSSSHDGREKVVKYLSGKLEFYQTKYDDRNDILVDFPDSKIFNLSSFFMMLNSLLRSNIEKSLAHSYYKSVRNILNINNIKEVFNGMNREFPIDNFTPFLFILFLYDYHRLYDKKNNIDESLKLIFSTLNLIHKNHLKFYRRKRTKLLLRQYRKSDLEDRYNLEMFYPICQNLIMNSLWYKVNKMAQELTELSGNENRKLQRRTEKIRKKINSNLLKSFSQITVQNLQALSFTLHPMMIYTLTSPFPILTGRNGKKMFKILTDLFISSNGIVFPIRRDEQIHFLSSPILLYEFLDAWLEYFGNDDTLSNKFQKIAKNLSSALYEGMIGLMDGILERKNKDLYFSHSGLGLATTEAYVFLKRFQEVKLQKVS